MADPLTVAAVASGILGTLGGLFKKNPKSPAQLPQFMPTQTQLPTVAPPPRIESEPISPSRYSTIAELMSGGRPPVAPAPRNDAILKLLMGG